VPFTGITAIRSGGYGLAMGNGIGYAAFDSTSLQPYYSPVQAFGAMLGAPAFPVVGIASTPF